MLCLGAHASQRAWSGKWCWGQVKRKTYEKAKSKVLPTCLFEESGSLAIFVIPSHSMVHHGQPESTEVKRMHWHSNKLSNSWSSKHLKATKATITKNLVKKQFGSKRKRSGWLFLIDSYGPKYIVHLKVKSKWHEETSSNEWELGNDRTCQKNRHRPVLVRTNRVYLAGKACEREPKSSLCQGNCLYMEECNTKTQIKNIKKLFLLFCTHPLHPIYIDLVVSTWFITHMENICSSNLAKCYWGFPAHRSPPAALREWCPPPAYWSWKVA